MLKGPGWKASVISDVQTHIVYVYFGCMRTKLGKIPFIEINIIN